MRFGSAPVRRRLVGRFDASSNSLLFAPVQIPMAALVLTSPGQLGDCSMVLGVGLLDSDGAFTTIVVPDSIAKQGFIQRIVVK
jgi:hypothetical protein